ncbi:MAG TPA: hypothetical protein DCZ10_01445 [Pelotomaculum sp.]|nr:hypothetical protein [Pelotomaculum sp.]
MRSEDGSHEALMTRCKNVRPVMGAGVRLETTEEGTFLADYYTQQKVALNEVSCWMVSAFDGGRTIWDIAGDMSRDFDADQVAIGADLLELFNCLNKNGLAFNSLDKGFLFFHFYHDLVAFIFPKARWI